MKLLVSTMQDCFVYDVDTRHKTSIERPTAGGRGAYGMTWRGSRAYIGWRGPCQVLEYDRALTPTGRLCQPSRGHDFFNVRMPDRAVHGILRVGEQLYVMNSGRDEILIFSADTLCQSAAWCPHDTARRYDVPHFKHYNGMCATKGFLYVVCHMEQKRASEVWKFHRALEPHNMQLVDTFVGGKGAHSCFPWRDGMALCDSLNNQVIRLGTNEVLYETAPGWMTRGVSCLGDTGLVLGLSGKEPERAKRNERHGRLLVWRDGVFEKDPEVHKLGVGPVCEVRCLDLPDAAHWPARPLWEAGSR